MAKKEKLETKSSTLIVIGMIVVAIIIIFFAVNPFRSSAQDKQIIRVAHNQSAEHPTHTGMIAFEEYIEEELGDRYDVQLFPSELLGTQTNMVQLTQTGAIDVTVASNSILETFNPQFQIFNLPYLFEDPEVYHAVMNDPEIINPIFEGTEESGFATVAWLDAGTRNFYAQPGPIEEPADLEGLKIRVQQSPTNVRMMDLLGGSATPMGFGDVYTSIQSGIIDGAENNELSLTENGHGDIVKYYSYTLHQMIPDEVIVSTALFDQLPEEDAAIFEKGFEVMEDTQHEAWAVKVEEAKDQAENEMGVNFNYPDTGPFKEAVMPLHDEILEANPSFQKTYDQIQEKAAEVSEEATENEEN
jgi:tripartite ATP-independent transporter DctP family solute receptor